ncbi:MAG TPA: urease accessory protein UreE [Rhodopila sp.]|jgi:urease accessory protein|nr:urease accessory protein UreE [Rhodopila sp.]
MRALQVLPKGMWDPAKEIDQVLIDYDRRFRRRIMLTTVSGQEVLIDQPQAVRLREGDGLAVENGVIRVRAKPEPCMDIHAHEEGELVRIAWHLGNRHLPVQLLGDIIRIRADHVIADMIEGLGGHVDVVDAPFDPEGGAYAGGHQHHHDDDEDHHHR